MAAGRRLVLVAISTSAGLFTLGMAGLTNRYKSGLYDGLGVGTRAVADHWPFALLAVGTVGLAGGLVVATSSRRLSALERDVRPLNWRLIAGMVLATLAAGVFVTLVLLREASAAEAQDEVGLRIDAIRTGVTVALGTGGVAVFLLAIRRQWLSERSQAYVEEDQNRRRLTELYATAVGQLGDNAAPVRLGGVQALARLAQDSVDYRPTVLNVLAAYLRMPFSHIKLRPVGDRVAADDAKLREELEVRLAAQQILIGLLSQSTVDEHLNLTGAVLVDFAMNDVRVGSARLDACVLVGDAQFSRATFGSADFSGARFSGSVRLDDAKFLGNCRFNRSTFEGSFVASRTTFTKLCSFDDVVFQGDALFVAASFVEGAWFNGARFGAVVDLGSISAAGEVRLDGAEVASFDSALARTWPPGLSAKSFQQLRVGSGVRSGCWVDSLSGGRAASL